MIMIKEEGEYLEELVILAELEEREYCCDILVVHVPAWIRYQDSHMVGFQGATTGRIYAFVVFDPPTNDCGKGR